MSNVQLPIINEEKGESRGFFKSFLHFSYFSFAKEVARRVEGFFFLFPTLPRKRKKTDKSKILLLALSLLFMFPVLAQAEEQEEKAPPVFEIPLSLPAHKKTPFLIKLRPVKKKIKTWKLETNTISIESDTGRINSVYLNDENIGRTLSLSLNSEKAIAISAKTLKQASDFEIDFLFAFSEPVRFASWEKIGIRKRRAKDLPKNWLGYTGTKIFYLDTGLFPQLSPAQKTALLHWVNAGGVLLVSTLGKHRQRLMKSFLSPGIQFNLRREEIQIQDLRFLANAYKSPIRNTKKLWMPDFRDTSAGDVTRLDGNPIYLMQKFGSGSLVLLNLDPARGLSVRDWYGWEALFLEIARRTENKSINPLVLEKNSATANFEPAGASIFTILFLLAGLAVVSGALHRFFLKKYPGKFQVWVTPFVMAFLTFILVYSSIGANLLTTPALFVRGCIDIHPDENYAVGWQELNFQSRNGIQLNLEARKGDIIIPLPLAKILSLDKIRIKQTEKNSQVKFFLRPGVPRRLRLHRQQNGQSAITSSLRQTLEGLEGSITNNGKRPLKLIGIAVGNKQAPLNIELKPGRKLFLKQGRLFLNKKEILLKKADKKQSGLFSDLPSGNKNSLTLITKAQLKPWIKELPADTRVSGEMLARYFFKIK